MIRPVGEPAGNNAPRRPPPPPPPHSSSWSTLSPLAPPFTVDRPLTPITNPSPPQPPAHAPIAPGLCVLPRSASNQSHLHLGRPDSPPSAAAYPWPTSSSVAPQRFHAPPGGYDWSPSSTTATNIFSSSILDSPNRCLRSLPSSSAVEAAPYYPLYTPAVMDDALGGPLPDSVGCMGVDVGHWNGPLEGDEGRRSMAVDIGSSWMDPSSTIKVSTFNKGNSEGFATCEDSWGPWHGKLVDSTAKKVQFGSDCSELLDGKHPAIYEENVRAPCNKFGTSVLGTDALHKRPSYFHSQDPVSMMEEHSAYNSNSSYDSYVAELVSCSADPMNNFPDRYSSSQVYAPLARRASLSMDYAMPANTYSNIQHEGPLKVNDDRVGYIPAKRNAISINQNTESKEGYMERSLASNNTKANNRPFVDYSSGSNMKANNRPIVDYSFMKKGLFLDNEATTGNSMDCFTELKSGLNIKHLNLPNSFPSGSDPAKPDDSAQTSTETLDQLNLVVDSPCWKGTPTSRQYPFGVDEAVEPYSLVNDSKRCGNLVQGQNHFPVSALNALSSIEEDESSSCIQNKNFSYLSLPRESSPVAGFPGKDKKFQDADEKGSDCVKVGNEKGSQCSDVLGGQSTEVYRVRDPEPKGCELGHKESVVSADQPTFIGETSMDTGLNMVAQDSSFGFNRAYDHAMNSISGGTVPGDIVEPLGSSDLARRCSPHGEDGQVLVKAMHGLSQILLSMYDGEADELKEHDHELVQLVIDNLKSFILKNKKVTAKCSSLVSGLEAVQSQVTFVKADTSTNKSNDRSSQDMKGQMDCIGSKICSNKFDNFVSGKSNGMAQVLEKALEESLQEEEENPQTLLYKNLWIKAEVAICSLKYELQLARLKLEMENHKNQTKDVTKKPAQMASLSSPNSMHALDGHDAPRYKAEESSFYDPSTVGHQTDNCSYRKSQEANAKEAEIDASVMARFRVLKGRRERSSSSVAEQQELNVDASDPENENNTIPNVPPPTKLVDLGFMGRNPQVFTEAELLGGSSIEKLNFDFQHLNANCEENAVRRNSSTTRESQVWTADGLPNWSNEPNRKGKHVVSCGFDTPSSEWEHVMEEELTWYNNP